MREKTSEKEMLSKTVLKGNRKTYGKWAQAVAPLINKVTYT